MMQDYDSFISAKHVKTKNTGFDLPVEYINQQAFEWQRRVIQWALKRGRAALFLDTGLGKTICQLTWAEQVVGHTGGRVLLHCPIGVRQQTKRESEKFGIECDVAICDDDNNMPSTGIVIANYEKLHKFDTKKFDGVVLDECFPAGTLIDTPSGQYQIETIRKGDTILNAYGADHVSDVHRREVKHAVRISIASKTITSSPNHPFFTQRGWVASQDLEPGDSVLQTREAVRMVREGVPSSAVSQFGAYSVLREILFSEMAYGQSDSQSESSYDRNACEDREESVSVACVRNTRSFTAIGASQDTESYDRSRSAGEGLPDIESHEPQTFRAWWQWQGDDEAAEIASECAIKRMGSGVCLVTGKTDSRLSDALQNGLRERRASRVHRGGWSLPSFTEGTGSEERSEVGFTRVDGIEILESGHPDLDQFRDADGKLYFYDIGATRHPSFSVNGFLVHNSSILKSFTGSIKRSLCDNWKHTDFRLACTATPSPNDHMELGNHAQFLGIMNSNEMLSRWFFNDTMNAGGYKILPHGEADFWDWVATWAACVSMPSDIGGCDDGYVLPKLTRIDHTVVPTDDEPDEGCLFRVERELTATTVHKEKRRTTIDRARKVAEIVENEPDEPWLIWCDTNYEADELKEMIPDAVDLRGNESESVKERKLNSFLDGSCTKLISKPTICGFGLNFQHCRRMVFIGLSYSYEQYYQAVRRCWRFGQQSEVHAHVVMAESEAAILKTNERKQKQHTQMQQAMRDSINRSHELATGADMALNKFTGSKNMELPIWLFKRK